MGCVQSNPNEDRGMSTIKSKAIGANVDEINDDVLKDILNQGNDSLMQRVSLSFSATNLPNLDQKSKTDAYVVLWELRGNQKVKLGMTEPIMDSLNPEFVSTINVNYFFESQQSIKLELYDADDATNLNNLIAQQMIGSYGFTLASLVSKRDQAISTALDSGIQGKEKVGEIKIQATELKPDYGKFNN